MFFVSFKFHFYFLESKKSTNSINDNFSSSRPSISRLFSLSRFCQCPSPQRQTLYSKQQFAASSCEIQKIGIAGTDKFEKSGESFK